MRGPIKWEIGCNLDKRFYIIALLLVRAYIRNDIYHLLVYREEINAMVDNWLENS